MNSRYNAPVLADSLAKLVDLAVGTPERAARQGLAAARGRKLSSEAALNDQTLNLRNDIAGSDTLEGVLRAAMAGGRDYTQNIGHSLPMLAELMGVANPADRDRLAVAGGETAAADTFGGLGQVLENNLAKQRISTGGTIQSAQIAAAQRAQAAQNRLQFDQAEADRELVNILRDGAPVMVPRAEAVGAIPIISNNEAKGAIATRVLDDIVNDRPVSEMAQRVVGADAPAGESAGAITPNIRQQIEMAIKPYVKANGADGPELMASVISEVARLAPEMGADRAMQEVMARIRRGDAVVNPSGTGLSRMLGINTSPDITAPTGPYRLAPTASGGSAPPAGFVVK